MEWTEIDNCLCAEFMFKNFREAFSFMTEVAFHAELQGHHPDWTNVYNRVSFKLNTHDAGGTVTDKDQKLAETITKAFHKYQG